MTQRDKELLLKDLCGRLPYGVMVGYSGKDNPDTLDKIGRVIYVDMRFGMIQMQDGSGILYGLPPSETIKPYLRSMSSMTEEESRTYTNHRRQIIYSSGDLLSESINVYLDWLNQHHFDYRGLIPKGLALEVTSENDPYKDNNQ